MRRGESGQQDAGQHVGAVLAMPQAEVECEGNSDRRRKPGENGGVEKRFHGRDADPMVSDHAHRPAHHQAAGRTEKSSDDGIGDEPNGAARACQTETTEQEPGERGGESHDDDDRREQIVWRAFGGEPCHQGRHQSCRDRDRGGIRTGDGEGDRAARCHDRGADCRRDEGRGNTVSEQCAQRRSENQGRKGEAIGHRDNAGDEAGENIRRLRPEEAGCRVPLAPGNGHFNRSPQGLCASPDWRLLQTGATDSSEL